MRPREKLIIVTLLKQLKGLKPSGPVHEEVLFNAVGMLVPKLAQNELARALEYAADKDNRWIIGVPGKLGGHKWILSDAGESALIELS